MNIKIRVSNLNEGNDLSHINVTRQMKLKGGLLGDKYSMVNGLYNINLNLDTEAINNAYLDRNPSFPVSRKSITLNDGVSITQVSTSTNSKVFINGQEY